MIPGKTLRVLMIGGAVILTGAVYLLSQTPTKVQPVLPKAEPGGFSFTRFESESKAKLEWNLAGKIARWDSLLRVQETNLVWLDSIAMAWDHSGNSAMAAHSFERKALQTQLEDDWINAAYRYFDSFREKSDSVTVAYFTGKAIECYSRVLEINPGNLKAKTDLGVVYAEGTSEPMKGIALLREVVEVDPNHEMAQLNLGYLSMKSGQTDKARERFAKVLDINPSRIDMYVYIGESFAREGKTEEAIKNLEIFGNLTADPEMKKEVEKYILTLKQTGAAEPDPEITK